MKTELLLNEYRAYAEANIVAVKRTRSAIKNLNKHLGTYDHSRLTPGLLRRYRSEETLAPASINRELGVLRAALSYAQRNGKIRSAPVITLREGANKRIHWLRPEQITALLDAASAYPETKRFIQLALRTAQRKEAILSLRWRQIDYAQRVIWFGDHDLSHADRRKGRGAVPLSLALEALLRDLWNQTPYVLVNARQTRFCDINRDHWRAIVTAIGEPDLTPHDLRHTAATNLLREKVPLIDVSKLLGHKSTAITEAIYLHHQPEFLCEAVGILDRLAG